MNNHQRHMIRMIRCTFLAALAGGSLFGACEVRLRDAIVGGSKEYLSTLLGSDSIFELFIPASDNASNTTNAP